MQKKAAERLTKAAAKRFFTLCNGLEFKYAVLIDEMMVKTNKLWDECYQVSMIRNAVEKLGMCKKERPKRAAENDETEEGTGRDARECIPVADKYI